MSYHIIKKIEINKEEGKVYITGADNNVSPRTPHRWHCSYYDELMAKKDYEQVELDILQAYEDGNFQKGSNKYVRALHVLRNMPEYEKFNWQANWDDCRKYMAEHKDEFRQLLVRALNTKLPKQKFVITKQLYGGEQVVYFNKRANAHFCRWAREKEKATKFSFFKDAEWAKKCFTGSENWQVVAI